MNEHKEPKKNRFYKLSLKKNRCKSNNEVPKINRSADVIILEQSFDHLTQDIPKNLSKNQIISSPIVINDSLELSINESLPKVSIKNTPNNMGNISISSSKDMSVTEINKSYPSTEGCSSTNNMVCITPKHRVTTPRELVNESLEECSLKKIEQSQKKLLYDLYKEDWKSLPALFRTIKRNINQSNSISKKLHFDDDASDNDTVRHQLRENKKLYLTGSDARHKVDPDRKYPATERKSKKKLYTELIPQTPEPPKPKVRSNKVNSTNKDKRNSVAEKIDIMMKNVNSLTKDIQDVSLSQSATRLTFMASLADNVPSWRCHIEAIQYKDKYQALRDQLTRRLFDEFNRVIFDCAFEADLPILWDTKLRSTAGITINRKIKTSNGETIRMSSIKLSTKVLDAPQRLRDTLVHELCHAATWIIDGELRAGHGELWRNWAKRALQSIPELGEISRCHNMEIHFKYEYKCTSCGYSVKRHSKSIDTTKKCCGICNGTFIVLINRKNKDGNIVTTPARKAPPNEFAMFVKENYGTVKDGRSRAEIMKLLGEQFSAKKKSKDL